MVLMAARHEHKSAQLKKKCHPRNVLKINARKSIHLPLRQNSHSARKKNIALTREYTERLKATYEANGSSKASEFGFKIAMKKRNQTKHPPMTQKVYSVNVQMQALQLKVHATDLSHLRMCY